MKVWGFKLTNFTSFGGSIFSAGFIQKTIKVDLDVRLNRAYPQQKQPQKVLEESRGHHTEAEGKASLGGAGWPHLQAGWPLGPTC